MAVKSSLIHMAGRVVGVGDPDFNPSWAAYSHLSVRCADGHVQTLNDVLVPAKLDSFITKGNDLELFIDRWPDGRLYLFGLRFDDALVDATSEMVRERRIFFWIWLVILAITFMAGDFWAVVTAVPLAGVFAWWNWFTSRTDRHTAFMAGEIQVPKAIWRHGPIGIGIPRP